MYFMHILEKKHPWVMKSTLFQTATLFAQKEYRRGIFNKLNSSNRFKKQLEQAGYRCAHRGLHSRKRSTTKHLRSEVQRRCTSGTAIYSFDSDSCASLLS